MFTVGTSSSNTELCLDLPDNQSSMASLCSPATRARYMVLVTEELDTTANMTKVKYD